MALKNVKSELDAVFKQLEVYGEAKYFILRESPQINKAVRASINASISASAAIGEKKQDMLNDAQENAEKAGKILVDLQKRLKEDYGKHCWVPFCGPGDITGLIKHHLSEGNNRNSLQIH